MQCLFLLYIAIIFTVLGHQLTLVHVHCVQREQRLLDSSERGKPDFDALEAAFMRIDTILRFVTVDVPGTSRHPASPALSGISSMSAMRHALPSPPITMEQTSPGFPPQQGGGNYNNNPALPPSPMSPAHRPQQQGNTLRTSEAMMELERSLDTSQVLDLFTMQPKVTNYCLLESCL